VLLVHGHLTELCYAIIVKLVHGRLRLEPHLALELLVKLVCSLLQLEPLLEQVVYYVEPDRGHR
jgi:hypothetical protein